MALVIWGNPIPKVASLFLPTPPTPLTANSMAQSAALDLSVDAANLMAHVEALSTPRTSLEQKSAARQYIIEQLAQYNLSATQQPYGTGTTGGVNIVVDITASNGSGSNSLSSHSSSSNIADGEAENDTASGVAAGSIILGAHYDTERNSPGADDNGSGIATLLEAARIFSSQLTALSSASASAIPRNLKLVFFDQEERQPNGSGLLGSLAFTEEAANLSGVKGAIILDMVGYACRTPGCQTYPTQLPLSDVPDSGDFLAILGLQNHTDLMGAFMLSAQTTWPTVLTLPIPGPMLKLFPDLLRSDHAPFWEKGIPAVLVSDTANFRNPNYHTPQDTPETLDSSFFRGSAQHVVNAIAALLYQTN